MVLRASWAVGPARKRAAAGLELRAHGRIARRQGVRAGQVLPNLRHAPERPPRPNAVYSSRLTKRRPHAGGAVPSAAAAPAAAAAAAAEADGVDKHDEPSAASAGTAAPTSAAAAAAATATAGTATTTTSVPGSSPTGGTAGAAASGGGD